MRVDTKMGNFLKIVRRQSHCGGTWDSSFHFLCILVLRSPLIGGQNVSVDGQKEKLSKKFEERKGVGIFLYHFG